MTTPSRLKITNNAAVTLANESSFARERVGASQEYLALYDDYFPRVYNYIRYRCGDPATSDDLTATTFERALDKFDDYLPSRGSFGAWLFAIARNVVNNYLRAERSQEWLTFGDMDDRPGGEPSPEERMIEAETQGELWMAVSALDDRDRDLLSLKFAARLTNRRIAEITGLSDSNVGIILYRALRKLRSILDGEKQA